MMIYLPVPFHSPSVIFEVIEIYCLYKYITFMYDLSNLRSFHITSIFFDMIRQYF